MEHGVSYTETYNGHIPDLGMSPAMDDTLRAALDTLEADDRDRWHALQEEINEAITAKIQECGVSADGEWLGEWSAEQIVRGVLGRYGVQCPAILSEYRVAYKVMKRKPGRDDFEEIGYGDSGIAETLEKAAGGAVTLLRSLTNDQGERAG
jgi:hypothetical protein